MVTDEVTPEVNSNAGNTGNPVASISGRISHSAKTFDTVSQIT